MKDDLSKKRHEVETLKSRHETLENRLSDLVKKGFWNEEETREINRIKWEKRDLKEKILQGEAQIHRLGSPS